RLCDPSSISRIGQLLNTAATAERFELPIRSPVRKIAAHRCPSPLDRRCTRDRGAEGLHDSVRVFDFDNESFVMLVIELDDHGAFGIMNVVEDEPAVLIERAGREQPGNLCSGKPQAMPPSARRFGVGAHVSKVCQWDLELALERPEPIPSLDLEPHPVAFHDDVDHRTPDSLMRHVWTAFDAHLNVAPGTLGLRRLPASLFRFAPIALPTVWPRRSGRGSFSAVPASVPRRLA